METPLPDALGVFHARLRLRLDIPVRYEGPIEEDSYIIAVLSADKNSLADIDFDPRREQPFAWSDRATDNPEVVVDWITELLPTPA